jgi:uncharacterized protein (DUF1501 family)
MLQNTATTSAILASSTTGINLPQFLLNASESQDENANDNVLVVIQLSGGNDGLNTIVPFKNDRYYAARPTLAIPKDQALKLNDELGFHPAMTALAKLYESGVLSIIQGVGYPNPNRSHFESMDIWHTCRRKTQQRDHGWIGQSVTTALLASQSTPILHLGAEKQPLALSALTPRAISIRSLEQFKLRGNQQAIADAVALGKFAQPDEGNNGLLDFVQSSTSAALKTSKQLIKSAVQDVKRNDAVTYSNSALAQKLQTTAQLIDSPLNTRVYYVTLDGFDTHAQQSNAHQILSGQWSSALGAFLADIKQRGQQQRVTAMVFSEFGRRIEENASKGTDHGTAAPMFLAGAAVKAGVIGEHPSLDDIQQGDLKHAVDFRQVYATVLDWMQWDSATALNGEYSTLPLFL